MSGPILMLRDVELRVFAFPTTFFNLERNRELLCYCCCCSAFLSDWWAFSGLKRIEVDDYTCGSTNLLISISPDLSIIYASLIIFLLNREMITPQGWKCFLIGLFCKKIKIPHCAMIEVYSVDWATLANSCQPPIEVFIYLLWWSWVFNGIMVMFHYGMFA